MNKIDHKQKKGMVDISGKDVTKRVAIACAKITMSNAAFKTLLKEGSPKGNVFETAKVAGVMAAKLTPQLIPMCHPLELNKATVTYEIDKKKSAIIIKAEVSYVGRTGVEMEAMVAATTAALTIYDMMKWADKAMIISDVKLLHKSGGKSGTYNRAP